MNNKTTGSKKAKKAQFSDAIREKWGFNDALLHATMPGYVAEWRRGARDTHFDSAYVRGYYAGMDATKEAK